MAALFIIDKIDPDVHEHRMNTNSLWQDYPGSSVVKTLPSNAEGAGLIPGFGAKIPRALQPKNQNIKLKQYHKRT